MIHTCCYAYILRCADGTLYTGWTNDLPRRVQAHNNGVGGKYTRSRLADKLGEVTSETVCAVSREAIQSCGITFKKAAYIKDFANKAQSGEFDADALRAMPDKEAISKLSALKGVGVWTAEMLMVFSLQRPDVISYGDLAIHRGFAYALSSQSNRPQAV